MIDKRLPIGMEDFETLIRDGYYYVDKTGFIRELIDNLAMVNLFTRPRRFGKTLTLSMCKAFFEKTDADMRSLFRDLSIESAGDVYWAHHARYPVVFLSLKDIQGGSFEDARIKMAMCVAKEALRHPELRGSPRLTDGEIALYGRICAYTETPQELEWSLLTLCEMLEKHHGERAVLLIDEYDVPLDRAFLGGYYGPMVAFMRSFLGAALKTNPALRFAVLTGCLRISRESIFTGLNNMMVHSIRDVAFRDAFGFTSQEVESILADFNGTSRIDDAKAWYNGYRFRNVEMYNPWDIIRFCFDISKDPNQLPISYWLNTSSNDLILRFVRTADAATREDIERLIDGQSITKPIREELTYGEIDDDPAHLWSFLLLTGYLTPDGEDNGERRLPLRIPNAEIREIYNEKIAVWFRERVQALDLRPLYAAVFAGDASAVELKLRALLLDSISYHDAHESFYHGFLVGLLGGCADWRLTSNSESGHGRSDILLMGADMRRGIVIEIKQVGALRALEPTSRDAIAQIREKEYAYPLIAHGYEDILLYAIVFFGKTCKVTCEAL